MRRMIALDVLALLAASYIEPPHQYVAHHRQHHHVRHHRHPASYYRHRPSNTTYH